MAKIKTNSPQDEVSLDNINPYFEIYLDTFLYNAGIIGFIEVLKNCGAEEGKNINDKKDYFIDGQTLHVSKEFLLNPNTDLAQGYINAVCKKFGDKTRIYDTIENIKYLINNKGIDEKLEEEKVDSKVADNTKKKKKRADLKI